MKKLFAAIAASLTLMSAVHAQTVPAPNIAARSWTLVDATSGQVIASQDANMRIEPASLTKVMTAYVVFGALRDKKVTLDQMVNVSVDAWKVDKSSSKMFIDPKVPVSIKDLLYGLMVQSGNDAAVALAEAVGGDMGTFATLMNREAQRLGMKDTKFANPHGLPSPDNYSTAHDLAILAQAVIRDYPEFYKIDSVKEFTYNRIKQQNRNRLLWLDPTVDGMKTGHTEAAGYNLIASSRRDGRRVLSVVVGTASPEARAVESSKLLNYGLQFFETPKLYTAGQAVSTLPVYKGAASTLAIGFDRDVHITVAKGATSRLKAEMKTLQPVIAPIKQGQEVGKLTVSLDGKVLLERPVQALKAVEEGGFFSRLWDSIKLWLGW